MAKDKAPKIHKIKDKDIGEGVYLTDGDPSWAQGGITSTRRKIRSSAAILAKGTSSCQPIRSSEGRTAALSGAGP